MALPAVAGAQSLAAVARSEEARRKQQPKAAKVYTNQDLTRDHTTPTTATPSAAAPADGSAGTVAPAAPEAPPADAAAPPTPARDREGTWR